MTGMVCFNHSSAGQSLKDVTYIEEIYQKPHLQKYQSETVYLFLFSKATQSTQVFWAFRLMILLIPSFTKLIK